MLLAVYSFVWLVFAAYGVHRIHLIRLFRRSARHVPPPARPAAWPTVTVQLPIYNERYVVSRLIEAAAAIDYPRDRLEIQVLDDSTDETREIAARTVVRIRARGIDVVHLTRETRDGFKAGALQHVLCPSELPVEMNAFKAQQHRWVKGSIQVARKLLPAIWRSPASLAVKVEASFHLTYNLAYVFLLLLSMIVYPVALARNGSAGAAYAIADTILFLIATGSVVFYFAYAQRDTRRDWTTQLRYLPFVMSLGMGLSVTNTRAVIEALVGH